MTWGARRACDTGVCRGSQAAQGRGTSLDSPGDALCCPRQSKQMVMRQEGGMDRRPWASVFRPMGTIRIQEQRPQQKLQAQKPSRGRGFLGAVGGGWRCPPKHRANTTEYGPVSPCPEFRGMAHTSDQVSEAGLGDGPPPSPSSPSSLAQSSSSRRATHSLEVTVSAGASRPAPGCLHGHHPNIP